MENKKITELLRLRDLCLKKIEKESGKFIAYDVITGSAKPSDELLNAAATFQSVFDLLTNACTITSVLRKANVATQTNLQDYWGSQMSVAECRQNMVGDKIVGLPSVHHHLKSLYNRILKQTSDVNTAVKNHNDSHNTKLKKIQESEYVKHEEERKSSRDQNVQLPPDFETAYETKLQNITDAFWLKNKAVQVDPIKVFSLLTSLSTWIDNFEKNKEMQLNRANNSEPVVECDLSHFQSADNDNDVSLEELASLIKDKNAEIIKLIDRLVTVSWKIGNNDPVDHLVSSAKENYDLILNMVKSYGIMQEVFRTVSTFIQTTYVNPMTKTKMSAVDMIDFKNIVVPIMKKMLQSAENQKRTSTSQVKSQEGSIRTEVVKLLEGSMNSASSRPTTDKIKEYTNNLMESVSSRVVSAPDIEKQLANYQQFLDEFDSQIRPALATVNANTRVKIVWELNSVPKVIGSWDTIGLMTNYDQPEIVESTSVYDDIYDFEQPPNAWCETSSWDCGGVDSSSKQRRNNVRGRGGRGR